MRKGQMASKCLGITLACLVVTSMFGASSTIASADSFSIGDTVEVTDNLNVRTGAGTSYPEISDPDYPGYAPSGTRGRISNGPTNADGYTWWQVDFGPGLYSGWSAENWLRKVTPAGAPDLTVTSVSSSHSRAEVGELISVTFRVNNQGSASSGSFSNRVSLATSAWGTTYSLGNFSMNSLSSRASQTKTVNVTIPSIPQRDYYVTVFTDGFQQVGESNENNNISSTYPSTISISEPVTEYTLTTHVNGQGSISPDGGTYEEGTRLTLTISPSSGWQFDHWGGDASGTSRSTTITMNSNKSVTAYFTEIPPQLSYYSLTTYASGQGNVSPSGDTYAEGTRVTLTASPSSGWQFDHWGGDASGTSRSTTITMNSNKSVTAYFVEIPAEPDITPPSISISSPSTGRTFTNPTITIRGTASDDTAVSRVEVRVDSGSWQSASGTSPWSIQVALNPGPNTIYARAVDTFGNASDQASITVVHSMPRETVEIIQDFIPAGRPNRPSYGMQPEWITVHDTANSKRGADALAHAKYLKENPEPADPKNPRSWHFTVDDHRIVQHLPLSEVGWHAGDGQNGTGNRKSIGIEICENANGNRHKAEENAVYLIARLLHEFNLGVDRVVPHQKWTGKDCPHLLLPRWNAFIDEIEQELATLPSVETGAAEQEEAPPQETSQSIIEKIQEIMDRIRGFFGLK